MARPVVVVGSGFAGMACAFHVADAGIPVRLIERKPVLGGYFRELQRQFPTNSCGVCFMHPAYPAYCPHIESLRHPGIVCSMETALLDIRTDAEGPAVVVSGPQGEEMIPASAVVLASGYEIYDPAGRPDLGGGVYDRVFGAIDMERYIYEWSAAGAASPFRRIAYIQCVGSRDLRIGKPWCSSFCCMYAVKQALLLKELDPTVDVTIFYMDLRAFGKDYERYCRDAAAQGVTFIRSAVAAVRKRPATGVLELSYAADGKQQEDSFDAVVLSQGASTDNASLSLLQKLGCAFDPAAFRPLADREVSRDVFVAGSMFEPMDIPDAVVDGIAAAARIIEKHGLSEKPPITVKSLPAKARDLHFYSLTNDPRMKRELIDKLPGIRHAEDINELASMMAAAPDDGAVIVADDIRIAEGRLKARSYGGVHVNSVAFVSASAVDVMEEVRSAEHRLRRVQRTAYHRSPVVGKVLVVGSGLAGLAAARMLGRLGCEVLLIERQNVPGGRMRGVNERERLVQRLLADIEGEGKVELVTDCRLTAISGRAGSFTATLERPSERRTAKVGAVLVATGGVPRKGVLPVEDGDRVFTFFDIDVHEPRLGLARTIAMLQCAGSRTDENPVCYRVCCTKAVDNAVRLKKKYPLVDIVLFHRDIRTYGYAENLYREARALGVRFVRVKDDVEIEKADDTVAITAVEEGTGEIFRVTADFLVLSTGIDPETEDMAALLSIPTVDGFLTPYNKKSGVLDLAPGMYGAGLALSANASPDVIRQAEAAAVRIALKLARKETVTSCSTAFVNPRYCCGCELCIGACPVSARYMDAEKKIAQVDDTLCEGCGTCAMVCTNKASQHKSYEHKEMLWTIDRLV